MLKVNEIFGPTLQGEGPSQGRAVLFLRLAFCNLSCGWCDSKYTWDWKQYKQSDEVHPQHEWTVEARLKELGSEVKALVVSGGEPLLQQRALIPLLRNLRAEDWWVEFETNGTIKPVPELFTLASQINCSPKLSNSGDSAKDRIKPEVLTTLSQSEKVFFKFVIGCEKDVAEVLEYVQMYSIRPGHVYLMPLGRTKEELALTTEMVKGFASRQGFIFSSRLHIELWGTKRRV